MNRLFPSVLTMSVRFFWVSSALLSGIALLVFSGCNDSSDVGLGVGPDSLKGGAPVTLDVTPDSLDTTSLVPRTGRDVTPTPTGNVPSWRFLVGRVDDPLTGEGTGVIEAEGYFDVSPPGTLPNSISDESDPGLINAELRLRTNYVHGDTASSVGLEVLELDEDAEMDRARADTSFPSGSAATDGPVSIAPNDSSVTIPLSDAWLADRLEALQEDSLGSFHGFKLTTDNSEDAVVGFSAASATLRLTHTVADTTADYEASKTFTHVEQPGPPPSPPDTASHRLLQDGIGTGLKMKWNFGKPPLDSLKTDPLNRAEIVIPVDTTEMKDETRSPTFARPLPKGFRILATRESAPDTPPCGAVRAPNFTQDGRECVFPLVPGTAPGEARVPDNIAFPTFDLSFQRIRNGQAPVFENVRLFIADRESTAENSQATIQPGLPTTLPILIAVDGDDPGPPRATLTVTPL